jgi:DNA-binding NarL/FixJ family response regulator
MTASIRVLVVDDQELVRAGLRMILESEPGIEVCGEAADGAAAIELALALRPDVVCMDVQMPGVDGLEATRALVASGSGARVLVLTTFDRDDYLFTALEAGASGFLLKNAPPERLIDAVQVLARGDALLAPDVTRRVLERMLAAPSGEWRPPVELTPREQEVLHHVARGASNAEVATALFMGEATVKTHVSHLLLKAERRDRVGLVAWAYEHGFAGGG